MLSSGQDAEAFVRRILHAIDHKEPMTITYRKIDGGEIVVRTVEPYAIDSEKGRPYMMAYDRDFKDAVPKRWRLERVLMYTLHKRGTRVLEHEYS